MRGQSKVKAFSFSHIVVDERACPLEDEPRTQPFLLESKRHVPAMSLLERGDWSALMSRESTALALSQVTAVQILPPLVELSTGEDLLNYQVDLCAKLDPVLVRELGLILEHHWRELGWEQLTPKTYLCVIGAGVAACISTERNAEHLNLRYANGLANELFLAGRAVDLPRSRLFLQTILYEKFNQLLQHLRDHCWTWM